MTDGWVKLAEKSKIPFMSFLCTLFLVVAAFAVPTPSVAQTTWVETPGTGHWCVYIDASVNGCTFQDPVSACRAQKDALGGPGQFYGSETAPDNWRIEYCKWETTPGWSLPAFAEFKCDTGYIESPGRCAPEPYPNCVCDPSQPTTGFPINILTGAKRFEAEDFATADASLAIERTFVSQPFGAQGVNGGAPKFSYGNWMASFDVQIYLLSAVWDTV